MTAPSAALSSVPASTRASDVTVSATFDLFDPYTVVEVCIEPHCYSTKLYAHLLIEAGQRLLLAAGTLNAAQTAPTEDGLDAS